MEAEDWKRLDVQTFGLPPSLFVPIAAASVDAVEQYVGEIVERVVGRSGRVNALLVEAPRPELPSEVPLWADPKANWYASRLHPVRQVWVHVDYTNYRGAWTKLGMSALDSETFLSTRRRRPRRPRGFARAGPRAEPGGSAARRKPTSAH